MNIRNLASLCIVLVSIHIAYCTLEVNEYPARVLPDNEESTPSRNLTGKPSFEIFAQVVATTGGGLAQLPRPAYVGRRELRAPVVHDTLGGQQGMDTGGASPLLFPSAMSAKRRLLSGEPKSVNGRPAFCDSDPLGKISEPPPKRTVAWKPTPGKYMLAVCTFGQLSNQLACMGNYFLHAALLNRTLVIPPRSFQKGPRYDWPWALAVNAPHARACLGTNSVITLDEYRELTGKPVAVDELICWMPPCFQASWAENAPDIKFPVNHRIIGRRRRWAAVSLATFLAVYSSTTVAAAALISSGDLYNIHVAPFPLPELAGGGEVYLFPPLESTCGASYIMPHDAIVEAARGFVRSIGEDFVAWHFRRGDMWLQMRDEPNCFWALPDVARFLLQRFRGSRVRTLFLSSDTHAFEVHVLRKLLQAYSGPDDKPLKLITAPRVKTAEGSHEWAPSWHRLDLDTAGGQEGMTAPFADSIFQKLVCVEARFFLGHPCSTFSQEIYRRRAATGRGSCIDGDLTLVKSKSFMNLHLVI
eukprot:jgi/Mesen1/1703/ME000138S00562